MIRYRSLGQCRPCYHSFYRQLERSTGPGMHSDRYTSVECPSREFQDDQMPNWGTLKHLVALLHLLGSHRSLWMQSRILQGYSLVDQSFVRMRIALSTSEVSCCRLACLEHLLASLTPYHHWLPIASIGTKERWIAIILLSSCSRLNWDSLVHQIHTGIGLNSRQQPLFLSMDLTIEWIDSRSPLRVSKSGPGQSWSWLMYQGVDMLHFSIRRCGIY